MYTSPNDPNIILWNYKFKEYNRSSGTLKVPLPSPTPDHPVCTPFHTTNLSLKLTIFLKTEHIKVNYILIETGFKQVES